MSNVLDPKDPVSVLKDIRSKTDAIGALTAMRDEGKFTTVLAAIGLQSILRERKSLQAAIRPCS
ncbi:hypothetical protein [Sphingomonas paeninsulae]|uniref:hypothetical protein n=1 Tax=Sphingomonas paeninsulae TaxID=2319844 RepID=UPI0013CF246F|nr:hypothetical protein [Sphingomonas paeninsulae]